MGLTELPRARMTQSGQSGRVRGLATIAGDLAAITAARAAALGFSLAAVVLTTRLLTPSGYAALAYLTVVATLIFTVCSAWTSAALSRYGREELDARGHLRATSWNRLVLTAPLLVAASAVVVALMLLDALPRELTWTFVGLAIALGALVTLQEHCVVVLEAAGRMRLSAAALALRGAALAVGLALLAATDSSVSPTEVAVLTVAVAAVLAAGLVPPVVRLSLSPPELDRALMLRMLVFAAPMIAFVFSQYGMRAVDIVVLRAYEPPREVGIYAVAYQSYLMLMQVATSATIVLTPLFVSLRGAGRTEALGTYFRRTVPLLSLASTVIVAIALPLVPLAVPVVFGEDFARASDPIVLLSLALVVQAIASLLAPILVLGERSRDIAVINVVAMVVNLAADVLLVGVLRVGIIGPAIATAVSVGLIAFGYQVVAGRCVDARSQPMPWIAAPLTVSLLATFLLSGAESVVVGIAGVLVTTWALLRFTSAVQPGDADLIRALRLPGRVELCLVRVAGPRSR